MSIYSISWGQIDVRDVIQSKMKQTKHKLVNFYNGRGLSVIHPIYRGFDVKFVLMDN